MIKKIILIVVLICSQAVYADDNVFVYFLKYTKRGGEDVVVYCGITNNPEARALEHASGGTMGYNTFDTMTVFAGPISRDQALHEETNCIFHNPIPRLYQTYPPGGDPTRPSVYPNAEEKRKAIEEYESHFDTSRLIQIPNPRVEYTPEIRRALVCEDCGASVTDGVINFSHENFDGHIFCMGCQPRHLSHPQSARVTEGHEFHSEALRLRHTTYILSPICEDCGAPVTDGVINFSRENFDGHVFCMDCQSKYR